MKKILIIIIILVFTLILVITFSDWRTLSVSKNFISSDISDIPTMQVGLVLGTSKYIADGRRNLFYLYRMNATKELYDSGKISYIIVSGDNGTIEYNEPDTMKRDLIELGIPEEKIYGDYAGFRTLDSVVRAREIFGQETYTIITQRFHLERAIYLARKQGIEAYGYPARDVPVRLAPRVWIRERLARVKMMYDVLTGVEPRFGGERVEIGQKYIPLNIKTLDKEQESLYLG